MLSWTFVIAGVTLLFAQPADPQAAPQTPPPTSAPASQPAKPPSALRKPAQADILSDLLRPQRAQPIQPLNEDRAAEGGAASSQPGAHPAQALLLEGAYVVERPGHFIVEEGHPKFTFYADGNSTTRRTLELLPNQLLETMEREAEAGFTEFIISAEVTSYHGENYLLLRKVLRRVGNGNVSP